MRKMKGVPFSKIFSFLVSSIFANGSSFQQQKFAPEDSGIPSYRGTNRFLSCESVDWNRLTGMAASSIISEDLSPIYREEGEKEDDQKKVFRCLVGDDTPFKRDRSHQVENAVKCFDHSKHSYYFGFRDIHLVYTYGLTTLPVSLCPMSSRDEESGKRFNRQMNDVLFDLIGDAKSAGIEADYLLFDSWFASPKDIRRGVASGYDVECCVIEANCAIAMIQYMILSITKRIQADPRNLGELFVSVLDEGTEEAFTRVMDELCSLFVSEMARRFNLAREKVEHAIYDVANTFLSAFKISLKRAY